MIPTSSFMQLVATAGLLALGAIACAVVDARVAQGPLRRTLIGTGLGLVALASMADPLAWFPGQDVDVRGAAIVLAGPFGGALSVFVAVGMAASMQIALGGTGAPAGLLSIAIAGFVGLAWTRHLARRAARPGTRDLHRISLSAGLTAIPGLANLSALGPEASLGAGFASMGSAMAAGMAAAIAGTEVLGAAMLWLRGREATLAQVPALQSRLAHLEHQLQTAQDAATRSGDRKSRFLANVTHEFRSPLTAISGYAELAMLNPLVTGRSQDPDSVRERALLSEYMTTIRLACEHLVAMTEDLLDFGKAEAGRLSVVVESVPIADLIARTAVLLDQIAAVRNVTLETHVAPGLSLRADPRRLQQILLNLATNAIKYSHQGGRVTIHASREAEYDLITVEDWGIGMSPAQLDVALEAYGQVDNDRNRLIAGTGLGLPLVQSLVELHGGTVEITSNRGKGTCVAVRLPRPAPAEDQATNASERSRPDQKSTARPLISQSS